MNTIGIDNNLDRPRIRKMLGIGLFASILTGIGDFILGFAEETGGAGFASTLMSGAVNLADWQLIVGGLLGVLGIVLEGLAFFAIYRLMADASLSYAHLYRTGIIGYIWLAPIGCHMNVGLLNFAYKYLLQADEAIAAKAATPMVVAYYLPICVLLVFFWLPMIIVQFKAFAKGLTPYPTSAKWFNLILGAIPALILGAIFGFSSAWGNAFVTMFLSFGNAFTFGGLLATLPSEEKFEEFRRKVEEKKIAKS